MSYRRRLMMVQKKDINYMYLTALEDGTFTFTIQEGLSTTDFTSVSYSLDKKHWTTLTNDGVGGISITTPTIETGGSVLISSTGTYNVGGNILSLCFGKDCDKMIRGDFSNGKYSHMFQSLFNNSKVVDASSLQLLLGEIPEFAFTGMFKNSSTIVLPPLKLPNAVKKNSHTSMFAGCISLTTMPDMSDFASSTITLLYECFAYMFQECSSLKYFTPIPFVCTASSYSLNALKEMFKNCTSLEEPPIQAIYAPNKATTTNFNNNICYDMFRGCTKLKSAPELPIIGLGNYAYRNMFYGDSKLSYVKALIIQKTNNSLQNWLTNVAATGIFVKHINATWTDSGGSGVPTGWTIIYYNPSTDKYYLSDKTTECDDHGNVINP